MLRTLIVLTLILLTGCRSQELATVESGSVDDLMPGPRAEARIESYADDLSEMGSVLFVRFTNNLGVGAFYPTRLRYDDDELQIHGLSMGKWERLRPGRFPDRETGEFVWLEPGDSVLSEILLSNVEGLALYDQIKVVAAEKQFFGLAFEPNDYHALMTFETPAYPIYLARTLNRNRAGDVPGPTVFPPLDRFGSMGANGSPFATRYTKLWIANRERLLQLGLYGNATVVPYLENLIRESRDPHMRLLAASLAVPRGSELAKQEIIEASKSPQIAVMSSAAAAIWDLWRDDELPWLKPIGKALIDRADAMAKRQGQGSWTTGWVTPASDTSRSNLNPDVDPLRYMFASPPFPAEPIESHQTVSGASIDLLKRIVASETDMSCAAVDEIGYQRDPRLIALLEHFAHHAQDGMIIERSVRALGSFSDAKALEALINCFDIDFSNNRGSFFVHDQAGFNHVVGDTLRYRTGQSIGDRKESWQRWWNEQGRREWTGKE